MSDENTIVLRGRSYSAKYAELVFREFDKLQRGRRHSIDSGSIQLLLDSSDDHFALWLEILTHTKFYGDLPEPVLDVLRNLVSTVPVGIYKETLDFWKKVYHTPTVPACPDEGKLPRFYAACLASHLRDHPVRLSANPGH